jgi:hypothetical protein
MAAERERNDFSPWVGVVNQGPLTSTTNVFRLEHMLAARPSAVSSRQVTVAPGAVAPDFTLERTDGRELALCDFRGRPVLLRFTRAVTDKIL